MTKDQEILITIKSLNERGYGLGKFEKQPVLVLNSLPGEIVKAKIFKKKKGIIYAKAIEINKASPHRKNPLEDHFLACSPWQILDLDVENKIKKDFIQEHFRQQAGFSLPEFELFSDSKRSHYRNKVEYAFFGDDSEKLSLAYFMREASFGKYRHAGCVLVRPEINLAANRVLDFLNHKKILAKQLKSMVLRYSFAEQKVVVALYCKDQNIGLLDNELKLLLDQTLAGIIIIHSTKKSPASIITGILSTVGQTTVLEDICGFKLNYQFDSFFQINPLVFAEVIKDLQNFVQNNCQSNKAQTLVDLYAGVGTIGLTLAKLVSKVIGVESSIGSQDLAMENALQNQLTNFEFVETTAESALEKITEADILVVDPPRSGLKETVIAKILEQTPKYLIYLSCNPQTQALDFDFLKQKYDLKFIKAYNFYPMTPHVENLIILQRKLS